MNSKKSLAVFLSKLQDFLNPKVKLEQYCTPGEIAADFLWSAYMNKELSGTIMDLGAGTGILGIGALLLGAKKVIFVEKDPDVLITLNDNLKILKNNYEVGEIEIVNQDILLTDIEADLIITNPPFGTRNKHVDLNFLEYAISHAKKVYSFHKTSTLNFLKSRINTLGATLVQEIDYQFPLRQKLEQHKKKIEYIQVSLLIIETNY